MNDGNEWFKMIMRLIGSFVFGFTILWQEMNRNAPISMLFVGKVHEQWKFGTQWNLHIHFVFYAMQLICDFNDKLNTKIDTERLRQFCDLIFHSLFHPWALHTFFIYWCGGALERNIVLDLNYNEVPPQWLNHVVHTLVLPSVLIESYIHYHNRPSHQNCILVCYFVGCFYTLSFYYISITSNNWGYLIFETSTFPVKLMISTFMAISVTFWYFFGGKLHNYLWRHQLLLTKAKTKQY